MANTMRSGYVAECFWPGVRNEDLYELGRRIEASVADAAGDGEPIRCLGLMLVIDDDVVLVLFTGPIETVHRVAERAEIPFGRILRTAHALWPPYPSTEEEPQEWA